MDYGSDRLPGLVVRWSLILILAWLIVTGVGCGIGNSGIWAFSQTLAGPHAVGRWIGLQNGFANLAGVVGPALTGFIVDWTGHFQSGARDNGGSLPVVRD